MKPWGKFFAFGAGPARGWRRHGPRVSRGDVRAAALLLLSEQPLHGYQIIQEIGERSGGMWRPSPGSVYPMLQQLEDEGLVEAEQAEGRRTYHLTDAGRAYVEEHRDELSSAWNAVTGDVTEDVHQLRMLAGQVMAAMGQVMHAGTEAQLGKAARVLSNTRRALYQILAEDEPEDAVTEDVPGDPADDADDGPDVRRI